MQITSLIVDILKLGLIGLVFLLMLLGFRLLRNEQRKKTPNKEILKRASLFVWQSILIAILAGAVELGHRIFDHYSSVPQEIKVCMEELESLNLISQHPNQTVESLRSAIRNTWMACEKLGELKDEE